MPRYPTCLPITYRLRENFWRRPTTQMCERSPIQLNLLQHDTFSARLTSQIHYKRFSAISSLIIFLWFCPEGIWKFHGGFAQRQMPCVSGGLHSPQSLEMLCSAPTTEGQNKLDRLKLPGDVHHTILSSTLVLWRQIMESSPVRLFTDCFQREPAAFRENIAGWSQHWITLDFLSMWTD